MDTPSTPNIDAIVSDQVKSVMVELVTSLLTHKPSDPVPHIYSYLLEYQKGGNITPITDNELNEIKNLTKKIDYYKELLGENKGNETESSNNSDDDDEVEDIQPKKKNIKQQR